MTVKSFSTVVWCSQNDTTDSEDRFSDSNDFSCFFCFASHLWELTVRLCGNRSYSKTWLLFFSYIVYGISKLAGLFLSSLCAIHILPFYCILTLWSSCLLHSYFPCGCAFHCPWCTSLKMGDNGSPVATHFSKKIVLMSGRVVTSRKTNVRRRQRKYQLKIHLTSEGQKKEENYPDIKRDKGKSAWDVNNSWEIGHKGLYYLISA